jgi:hypothetical protein
VPNTNGGYPLGLIREIIGEMLYTPPPEVRVKSM